MGTRPCPFLGLDLPQGTTVLRAQGSAPHSSVLGRAGLASSPDRNAKAVPG